MGRHGKLDDNQIFNQKSGIDKKIKDLDLLLLHSQSITNKQVEGFNLLSQANQAHAFGNFGWLKR